MGNAPQFFRFYPINILHPPLPQLHLIYHFHFITVFKKLCWLTTTGDHVWLTSCRRMVALSLPSGFEYLVLTLTIAKSSATAAVEDCLWPSTVCDYLVCNDFSKASRASTIADSRWEQPATVHSLDRRSTLHHLVLRRIPEGHSQSWGTVKPASDQVSEFYGGFLI